MYVVVGGRGWSGRTPIYEAFDFVSNSMGICFDEAKKELFSKFKLYYYSFKSEYKFFVIVWLLLEYFYPNSIFSKDQFH